MQVFDFIIEPLISILPRLPEVLFNLLVAYVLIKLILWVLKSFLKATNLPDLKGIALSVVNFVLWIVVIIYISNVLGFTQFAIALSGSVLILAFLLNNGLAPLIIDAISGIFLCTDGDFKVGSRVRLGKGENVTEGRILEIDMRKVRIRDDNGNIHVVPNSVVDKDEWMVLEKTEGGLKKSATVAKEKAKEAINKMGKKAQ